MSYYNLYHYTWAIILLLYTAIPTHAYTGGVVSGTPLVVWDL